MTARRAPLRQSDARGSTLEADLRRACWLVPVTIVVVAAPALACLWAVGAGEEPAPARDGVLGAILVVHLVGAPFWVAPAHCRWHRPRDQRALLAFVTGGVAYVLAVALVLAAWFWRTPHQ